MNDGISANVIQALTGTETLINEAGHTLDAEQGTIDNLAVINRGIMNGGSPTPNSTGFPQNPFLTIIAHNPQQGLLNMAGATVNTEGMVWDTVGVEGHSLTNNGTINVGRIEPETTWGAVVWARVENEPRRHDSN
jgi:hypothetical protein